MARHEKPKAMTSVSEPCAARAAHCDARGDAGPAPAVGQTFVRATSSSVLTTAAMTETAMPELVLLRAAASKPEYVAEKALPPPPELGHEDGDMAQLHELLEHIVDPLEYGKHDPVPLPVPHQPQLICEAHEEHDV